MASGPTERLVQEIAAMDRGELLRLLRKMDCSFKLDFTEAFLQEMSIERLRHITLAALLHSRGIHTEHST